MAKSWQINFQNPNGCESLSEIKQWYNCSSRFLMKEAASKLMSWCFFRSEAMSIFLIWVGWLLRQWCNIRAWTRRILSVYSLLNCNANMIKRQWRLSNQSNAIYCGNHHYFFLSSWGGFTQTKSAAKWFSKPFFKHVLTWNLKLEMKTCDSQSRFLIHVLNFQYSLNRFDRSRIQSFTLANWTLVPRFQLANSDDETQIKIQFGL